MKPRSQKLLNAGIVLAPFVVVFAILFMIARLHGQFWQGTAQVPNELKHGDFRTEFLAGILPIEATDIHYRINIKTDYYASFNVSEQEFLNWAAKIESTSIARTATGQTIKKLRQIAHGHSFFTPYPESEQNQYGRVWISAGYYTEVTRTTELMFVELAYDSERKRAYLNAKRF